MGAAGSVVGEGDLSGADLFGKPLDASDVEDLSAAKEEIQRLRTYAQKYMAGGVSLRVPVNDGLQTRPALAKQGSTARSFGVARQDSLAAHSMGMLKKDSPTSGQPSANRREAVLQPDEEGSIVSSSLPLDTGMKGNTQLAGGEESVFNGSQRLSKILSAAKKGFEAKPKATRGLLKKGCESNILFRTVNAEELSSLIGAFEEEKYCSGDVIIEIGDPSGDKFYIIQHGTCSVNIRANITPVNGPPIDNSLRRLPEPLAQGDAFGELALLYNTPRAARIEALEDVTVWALHRRDYKRILTAKRQARLQKFVNLLRPVKIENSPALGELLSEDQLSALASTLEREDFEDQEMIFRQGSKGDFCYLIESGAVDVHVSSRDKAQDGQDRRDSLLGELVTTLESGAIFGERALMSSDERAATCIARGPTVCLCMAREHFDALMGSLSSLQQRYEQTGSHPSGELSITLEVNEEEAAAAGDAEEAIQSLDELEVLGLLGHGAFGVVRICRSKSTQKTFALKAQSKQAIIKHRLEKRINNEKTILEMCNHPFIVRLHGAFSTPGCIFFVLELLQGGELFAHLRKKRYFEESVSRFYMACVLLALTHVHSHRIAYRDIKPENLVLNSEGYVKIVDFGLAKALAPGAKTFTLCGTPDYLAPELICNDGHDWAVDYWALGVLCYELCAGVAPFYAKDNLQTYENILEGAVKFPKRMSRPCAELIRRFLRQRPTRRLGYTKGGANVVKEQRWFSGVDWHLLEQLELEAPFVPQTTSNADTSNFHSANSTTAKVAAEVDKMEQLQTEAVDWNPGF